MTRDTLWLGRAYEFVLIPEFWATAAGKYVLAGFVFSTANQWWAHPDPASAAYSIVSYHTCALAAQLLVVVGLCAYYIPLPMRCCGFSLLHCCQCRYEVAAVLLQQYHSTNVAVCSVVGRIAAILYMYCLTGTKMHEIAFGHYLIAYRCWCCVKGHRSRTIIGATWVRGRYSRQVQLVWERSDAGVIVKYLLGHTSLLLMSWHLRAVFESVTSTFSPQQLTLYWL